VGCVLGWKSARLVFTGDSDFHDDDYDESFAQDAAGARPFF
jgi:hypothetical protein